MYGFNWCLSFWGKIGHGFSQNLLAWQSRNQNNSGSVSGSKWAKEKADPDPELRLALLFGDYPEVVLVDYLAGSVLFETC